VPRFDSTAARAYREAPLPAGRIPWREVTYSVIDFETTGLDPSSDEIIAFAAVTVSDGRVQLRDARYELVRPSRMPDPDTIRIHGLREVDLSGAPSLPELLDGLLEAIAGRALVAHVASVERGFLEAALTAGGLELRNPIIDTAMLDHELRRLRRQPPSDTEPIGLSAMARELGLPVHRRHHADGDALTTAQAFIALATHLDQISAQTLGSLVRISRPRRRRVSLRSALGRFGIERFRR
jgi:DNA polymerase III subunit epsilon